MSNIAYEADDTQGMKWTRMLSTKLLDGALCDPGLARQQIRVTETWRKQKFEELGKVSPRNTEKTSVVQSSLL